MPRKRKKLPLYVTPEQPSRDKEDSIHPLTVEFTKDGRQRLRLDRSPIEQEVRRRREKKQRTTAAARRRRRLYMREFRKKNPTSNVEIQRAYRKRAKEWLVKWLQQQKCVRCGMDDWRILQFHHRDPSQKEFSVGVGVGRYGKSKLLKEMAKCDVLCPNCHALHHYLERQND